MKIFDCSNSEERPIHRGGESPITNDVMRYLHTYANNYGAEFIDNPENADVIITNDVFPQSVLSLNKPLVKRMCAPFWQQELQERNIPLNKAAQQANKVIFITEYSKRFYERNNPKLSNCCVIKHWVDPKQYYFRKMSRDFRDERFTFAAIATDWSRPEKRLSSIIEFAKTIPYIDILLIGKCEEVVPENIKKFGYLKYPYEVNGLLNSCDAFLNLSFNDAATKTVCQAINCRLPVLYASSGGISEMVGEYGLGYFEPYYNYIKIGTFTSTDLRFAYKDFMREYNRYIHLLKSFDPQKQFDTFLSNYFEAIKSVVL